jgi:protein-L-isoaspartate(D-aspartate) O-methyltransferase
MDLIDNLIKDGWLETPRIIEAFRKIKRADFLPDDMRDLAELNQALPIGSGQTISQPLTVAFMLEKLQPQPGDKILDIGSGSGWTTALLSQIVQPKGRVIAIEIVTQLKEFGERNVAKYNFMKKGVTKFILADGKKGYKKEAPFDRILVSASAKSVPRAWKEQLKVGGRIVVPIETSIWLLVKKKKGRGNEPLVLLHSAQKGFVFEETEFPGFVFVPLISK